MLQRVVSCVRMTPIVAVMLALQITARPGLSASDIANLGKPMNLVSPYPAYPISGFRRMNGEVKAGRKAELMFLGTLAAANLLTWPPVYDDASAAERWPVVKALEQFGRFSALRAESQSCVYLPGTAPAPSSGYCVAPTFDWSRASYSSACVAFDHKDLVSRSGARFQRMSASERSLYYRYARNPAPIVRQGPFRPITFPGDKPDDVLLTVAREGFTPDSTRVLPLVAVGRYVQTVSQLNTTGSFERTIYSTGGVGPGTPAPADLTYMSFAQVQSALQHDREPFNGSQLVLNVNAEANVITALICHADGGKPGSVCGRPAIRSILRHVR